MTCCASVEASRAAFLRGAVTVDFPLDASRRLLEAELAMVSKRIDQCTAYQRHFDEMKTVEMITKELVYNDRFDIGGYLMTKAERLEAEVWLLQAKSPKGKTPPAEEDSPQIRALLLERRDTRIRTLGACFRAFSTGRRDLHSLLDPFRQVLEAELAVASNPADQLAAYQVYLSQTKTLEKYRKAQLDAGRTAAPDYLSTKAVRLEAEILLLRAKSQLTPPSK